MTNSDAVKTTCPEYQRHVNNWKRVRDAVAGELRNYLRNVGANENDKKYGDARQAEYEDGAICYNFTKRTLAGMVGAVMRKQPEQIIPSKLKYLLDNCDGSGVGLLQHAQDTLMEIDSVGRGGLLVDAPNTGAATMAEQNSGLLNPVIAYYSAENIINWRLERTGSVNRLALVVLREPFQYYVQGNEFQPQTGEQYRVLDVVDGKYRQRLWRFGDADTFETTFEEVFPKLGSLPAGEIPFTFIGASNNDATVDDAPLLPLANLNIGHYRNSADNEENLFVVSQAMLIIAPGQSISPEQWQELNPEGVKFGARRGINVGSGGDAKLIQAAATNALTEAMKQKEEQAIMIGAQLITPTTQITAESARLQRGADTSVMSTIANNVSEAYTRALKWCAAMLSISPGTEIEFKLNTEFFLQMMTAQDRAAWMADINAGYLPVTAYYAALRAAGVTDWSDADIKTAVEEQPAVAVERQPTQPVNGEIPASAQQPQADNQQNGGQ